MARGVDGANTEVEVVLRRDRQVTSVVLPTGIALVQSEAVVSRHTIS